MKLYTFFRSGTSHRLRIALNLKGLAYEQIAVDLRREQHLTDDYKAVNPQQLVPALDVGGRVLTQSPAIIEWLEERHPEPPLLPSNDDERARCERSRRSSAATSIRLTTGASSKRCGNASAPTIRPSTTGAEPGSARVSMHLRRWSKPTETRDRTHSASGPRWPTSTSCPRSRAHAGSRSTWPAGRAWRRSTRLAAESRRSVRLHRRCNPTPADLVRNRHSPRTVRVRSGEALSALPRGATPDVATLSFNKGKYR